jgi:hypothetical protein
VEYEQFDYDIIHTHQGPVADSVANEIWPLLRILWRARGGYSAEIRFNITDDLAEFGDNVACPMAAVYKFAITDGGEWSADFDVSYRQPEFTAGIPYKTPDQPWCAIDFGRNNSNSAVRARRLARPDLADPSHGFNDDDWARIQVQHQRMKSVDLSFAFRWTQQGSWSTKAQRGGVFAAMLAEAGTASQATSPQ